MHLPLRVQQGLTQRMRAQTGMRHGSTTHGNTTWKCDAWEHDMAQCTNDAIYGTTPNEDATASNDVPGITHPPRRDFTSHANEYQRNPPPPDPAYQHLNDRVLGQPAQTAVHELEYGPSTPHPLQQVWGTTSWSTGPQYPAPTAAGVRYCKILNQNLHKPPTTNLLNNTPQMKTVNKAPQTKTRTLKGVPNGTGPDQGI
ncbi:hypothetical protein BS47DRAFT_1365733 [Hydnum rufescens UP504]|uniref:Uncharacterized protein n=1 Tax=Hydnum rufescens UP504 TaxID=1448309 RepID=A0A9P6AMV8_9AGAM|nr:hypothetical protein BS47DRAFT_1365733 [Hydnum rufescens UP504]